MLNTRRSRKPITKKLGFLGFRVHGEKAARFKAAAKKDGGASRVLEQLVDGYLKRGRVA